MAHVYACYLDCFSSFVGKSSLRRRLQGCDWSQGSVQCSMGGGDGKGPEVKLAQEEKACREVTVVRSSFWLVES